jgi:hypothetical protein
MFPCLVEWHCVEPNNSNDIRISVSVLILCKNVLWCNMFQEKKYQVIKQAVTLRVS